MRLLGRISNETDALAAQGALLSRQINCRLETASPNWELWALDEDKVVEAREIYRQFFDAPDKSQYENFSQQVAVLTARTDAALERGQREFAERMRLSADVFEPTKKNAPLSMTIVVVCASLWLLQTLFPIIFPYLCNALQIAPLGESSLDAIFSRGQIWRLFSPILLHAPLITPDGQFQFMGLLHIAFNMLWIKDLAPLIEFRHGTWYLLALLLATALGANLTQYFLAGPHFIGISGVVYGLLGFLWMRGKVDRNYGVALNPSVVYFMLIWLAFCMLGSTVANGSHIGGLIIGAAWGGISGALRNR